MFILKVSVNAWQSSFLSIFRLLTFKIMRKKYNLTG